MLWGISERCRRMAAGSRHQSGFGQCRRSQAQLQASFQELLCQIYCRRTIAAQQSRSRRSVSSIGGSLIVRVMFGAVGTLRPLARNCLSEPTQRVKEKNHNIKASGSIPELPGSWKRPRPKWPSPATTAAHPHR